MFNGNNKKFNAGMCRTADNVSARKIDCSNGSNVLDQILIFSCFK